MQVAVAATTISLLSEAKAPWTCKQLEMSTDPFYRMFPAYLGSAKEDDESSQVLENLQGHCFMKIGIYTTMDLNEAEDELRATVTFDLDQTLGFCTEHMQVSTAFSDYYNFYFWGGQKEFTLKYTDPWEIADVRQNGLRFFTYCSDPFTYLESSVNAAFMWIGGSGTSKYLPMFGDKPTNFQKEANSQLIEQFGGMELKERVINIVNVDQSKMQTGDILIGRRYTGSDAEWMILSGGYASHAAMIVADKDSLVRYVVECPSEVEFFENKGGVQKTELNEWLGKALAQDFEIAWLPLDKNLRGYGDLDEDKLTNWLRHVKGSQYSSLHQFLAAIDTVEESFPAPLNAESFDINLRLYGKMMGANPISKSKKSKNVADLFQETLTKRIETLLTNEQLSEYGRPTDLKSTIIFVQDHLNMSLLDIVAMPEKDSYHYNSYGGMPVFTPASFIASALKVYGVFHGTEVNAAEFTVKDIYQLQIYDASFDKPDRCNEADYSLEFCQLFGTYRLELPGYNTIHPYEYMNEWCPNAFENKIRPSDC